MLTQTFRDVMPKAKALGNRIVEQLDDIIGQFTGLWNVQHHEDGSHGDVTADSLVVSGDVTIGGDLVVDGAITGNSGTSAAFDNLRLRGQDNNNLGYVRFATDEDPDDASAQLGRTEESGNPAVYSSGNFIPAQTFTYALGLATKVWNTLRAGTVYIGGLVNTIVLADDISRTALTVSHTVVPTTSDAQDLGWTNGVSWQNWRNLFIGAIFEKSRVQALGYWTAVAFAAGNFTGNGSMTWTVASGDVSANRYTLIGNTMVWNIRLSTTTVGGTPNTQLLATIPGGFSAAHVGSVKCGLAIDNATLGIDAEVRLASATQISFQKASGANWTASTDLTYVWALVTIELA